MKFTFPVENVLDASHAILEAGWLRNIFAKSLPTLQLPCKNNKISMYLSFQNLAVVWPNFPKRGWFTSTTRLGNSESNIKKPATA